MVQFFENPVEFRDRAAYAVIINCFLKIIIIILKKLLPYTTVLYRKIMLYSRA